MSRSHSVNVRMPHNHRRMECVFRGPIHSARRHRREDVLRPGAPGTPYRRYNTGKQIYGSRPLRMNNWAW